MGEIVFGTVGDESRLEHTVIGNAVNLAAKLETHNKAARTTGLTTREAYALAVAQGYRAGAARGDRVREAIAGGDRPIDLTVLA